MAKTSPKKRKLINQDNLAGISYVGISGASKECQRAVEYLVQVRRDIASVKILTCENEHALLATTHLGDQIAIKSGFTTGYLGEGPRRFSYVLQLLETFKIDITEHEVGANLFERLNFSALTLRDIDFIEKLNPIRPSRWHDFIQERHYERNIQNKLLEDMPVVMPFAIIDARIVDLAKNFWQNTDNALLDAYRRLEDLVRVRTGLAEHGSRLFSEAFASENPPLSWKGITEAEKKGRMNLFVGAYMAHRNPRAHQKLDHGVRDQLSEFLLLNHLFRLESVAIKNKRS